MGVALLRSTSILPTFTLPKYSVANSSTMGAIARQGPHQVAQKSISTGLSDFNTSASKFASVTSTIELLAIVPPRYLVPATGFLNLPVLAPVMSAPVLRAVDSNTAIRCATVTEGAGVQGIQGETSVLGFRV